MIKAEELIEISLENSKDKVSKCLEDITTKITTVAKAGEFSYTYSGGKYSVGFLRYIAKILGNYGYKVTYSNSMLEITWYDSEEKIKNKENKTSDNKQNKSMQKTEGTKTDRKDFTISSSSKE